MLFWLTLYGILAPILFVSTSLLITKTGRQNDKKFRILIIVSGIIFLGGMVVIIPFIDQPRLANLYLRYYLGIPLSIIGMIFRIYPLLYFKKMKTRPDLIKPSRLVTSGPYSIIRHPQYVAGIIFIIGWFFVWGGVYSIYFLPVLIVSILLQALIEERYILEKEFGKEYENYKKTVGMFLPTINTIKTIYLKNKKEV